MTRLDRRDRDRLRLLVMLLVLVAALSAVLLAVREMAVRRATFSSTMEQRGEAAAREFESFFQPMQAQLGVIRGWGSEGDLDPANPELLDRLFVPVLENQHWAAGITLVGADASAYRLAPGPEGWERNTGAGVASEAFAAEWYATAVGAEPGLSHWNVEEGTGGPVFVASVSWADPALGGQRRVAGLHVATAVVDSIVGRFPVTGRGLIAVEGSDGDLSWHMPEQGPRFVRAGTEDLLDPEDGPESLLSNAHFARRRGAGDGEAFRFDHDGKAWWGWWGALSVAGAKRELVLLAPEADLSAGLVTVTSPLTWALLGVLALCVGLLVRSAIRFRGRLERLTRAGTWSHAEPHELRALIDSGEGDALEFKSTLRWNLRENRPGREIELSALKTVVAFLNTSGGTLLVGVGDDGRIVGTERDGFANEDKYLLHLNNLVQRHVGVEFARYLSYAVRPIEGKSILVIDVLPADEPAFLIDNDDDKFYVRMGPASRRLSVRRTFEYLKEFPRA